mgnify:CR=1 FL=1
MLRLRIHYKITLVFILLVTCLFIGTFIHLKHNIKEFTYQHIREDMIRKTSLARAFLEGAARGTDLSDLADEISRHLQLRVTIIDAAGAVLGDSDVAQKDLPAMENHLYRQEVQDALASGYGESRRFSTSVKQDFLYMAMPYQRGSGQGFMRLALPLDEIGAVSKRLNSVLIFSFIIAFVFSVLGFYAASFVISKPITAIAQGARRIAAGNFDGRIFVPGNDEIGDLARAFNDMAQQIRERINEAAMGTSQLEAVFSSMVEGVLVVDSDGTIFLMNQALRGLLNIDGDPIGRRPLEVVANADIQEMIACVESGQKPGCCQEVLFSLPENRVIKVQSAPVRLKDGQISGVVLVFHDMTELRRLENIRKEFVANVSHELRTPAASIKGYAETLLDGALDDPDNARDFVRIMAEDADRLAKLIEDLLDLSAIESGKMSRDVTECGLGAVLHKAVESLGAQARAAGVTVKVKQIDDVQVKGDELGLYRMFLNLIENAVKYNREDGRVDIETRLVDSGVEIRVQDTGIGIPEEDIPRIFERFYRVDKARSRQLGGTGLGLAIVKHIVQAHGGSVSVESVLGQGSVFIVILPANPA